MQELENYQRVEKAIGFIMANHERQPTLEEIAAAVHVSPFHFQRIFQEWAGVSPKKFLQYVSAQHARVLLRKNYSLAEVSFETGLSGTSRLHDLFVAIEAMTPGEYKSGGASLEIVYSFVPTVFGTALIASTPRGICNIDFVTDEASGLLLLHRHWPQARLRRDENAWHAGVRDFFGEPGLPPGPIRLHLKATPFQLKVWEALLRIPTGQLVTYGSVASYIGHPSASRAVGTAIGDNPVAYLIPCHRVIRSTGIIGEYRWDSVRKTSMIGWEQSRLEATGT